MGMIVWLSTKILIFNAYLNTTESFLLTDLKLGTEFAKTLNIFLTDSQINTDSQYDCESKRSKSLIIYSDSKIRKILSFLLSLEFFKYSLARTVPVF